jgi:hypothetical protein
VLRKSLIQEIYLVHYPFILLNGILKLILGKLTREKTGKKCTTQVRQSRAMHAKHSGMQK